MHGMVKGDLVRSFMCYGSPTWILVIQLSVELEALLWHWSVNCGVLLGLFQKLAETGEWSNWDEKRLATGSATITKVLQFANCCELRMFLQRLTISNSQCVVKESAIYDDLLFAMIDDLRWFLICNDLRFAIYDLRFTRICVLLWFTICDLRCLRFTIVCILKLLQPMFRGRRVSFVTVCDALRVSNVCLFVRSDLWSFGNYENWMRRLRMSKFLFWWTAFSVCEWGVFGSG